MPHRLPPPALRAERLYTVDLKHAQLMRYLYPTGLHSQGNYSYQ